jgi:hypothetical protein
MRNQRPWWRFRFPGVKKNPASAWTQDFQK